MRKKPKSLVEGKAIRWIVITALAAMAIWIGAGCKSMPYLEDARIGLTGIDLRFHEPKLPIEEQGFFGNFQYITNRMESAPMPVVYPRLMNMNGEIK